jgi:hypothetical protein
MLAKFKDLDPAVVFVTDGVDASTFVANLEDQLGANEAEIKDDLVHTMNQVFWIDGDGFHSATSIDTSASQIAVNQTRLTESKVILKSATTIEDAMNVFGAEVDAWVGENDEQCGISSNVSTFQYEGIFWILFLGRKTK